MRILNGVENVGEIVDAISAVIGFGSQLYHVNNAEIIDSVSSIINVLTKTDKNNYAELINTLLQDEKIEENIARDKRNDDLLKDCGWIPIHFWEKEVNRNVEHCVDKLIDLVQQRFNETVEL